MYRKEDNKMGNYTVPENVRAFKPKGSIVKKIKNNYYVYSHSQIKDEKTGKWKTSPGKLLGKIIPNVGFCPKESKIDSIDNITCFNYGEYLLVTSLAKDEFLNLCNVFNIDEAMIIFYMASLYAMYGYVGVKSLEIYFKKSLIHRDYPELPFSYHIIAKLLDLIGRSKNRNEYQNMLFNSSSDTLAFDGHTIATFSDNNELASTGYKTSKLNSTYMNLMVALDVKTLQPVATHVFPGYMLDKVDFISFCSMIGSISGKILLVDMGFFSEENLTYIKAKNGFFVIPVSMNRKEYKNIISTLNNQMIKQFLYHRGNKIDTVEYYEKTINNRRYIYYKNITEAEKLTTLYLNGIENCKQGYSLEKFNKTKNDFGVIILETNLDKTEKEIYELYKSRWAIETYYDRLKNGLHFEALNCDNYFVVQGLAFVMMIASRIDAKIQKASKEVKTARKELIQLMRYLKLLDDNKNVRVLNVKKEHMEILSKLGISINPSLKCLD